MAENTMKQLIRLETTCIETNHMLFLSCISNVASDVRQSLYTISKLRDNLSHVMRKPAFCICENKDADQLRGNREADQRLCFRYIDSTIPLLPKYQFF